MHPVWQVVELNSIKKWPMLCSDCDLGYDHDHSAECHVCIGLGAQILQLYTLSYHSCRVNSLTQWHCTPGPVGMQENGTAQCESRRHVTYLILRPITPLAVDAFIQKVVESRSKIPISRKGTAGVRFGQAILDFWRVDAPMGCDRPINIRFLALRKWGETFTNCGFLSVSIQFLPHHLHNNLQQ
jgi:hypothetical protein